ncbi:MAG: DinB family protein [Bacteroidetes bacterium]|nr:DinB family protein [Bacteroidota bacterium]
MKELLKGYASYNTWASRKLLDVILQLTEEQQHAEMRSSYPSLYKTVLHMLDAESIWWQRLKLLEKLDVPSKHFSGSMNELADELMQQSKRWEDWVNAASPLMLEHVFQYQTFTGEQFKQPTWQMVMHVINHSTYHRGQLITMLRELGLEKLPATDFILWSRGNKK